VSKAEAKKCSRNPAALLKCLESAKAVSTEPQQQPRKQQRRQQSTTNEGPMAGELGCQNLNSRTSSRNQGPHI